MNGFLPRMVDKVYVPPVKCQGIKTKLVPFIMEKISWAGEGRWIEPFLGSGVVLFNVAPRRALATDLNPHIIALYQRIYRGEITPSLIRTHLEREGQRLSQTGPGAKESYYYVVRQRFNEQGDPLDFLFLNRSCFNGMVRFNRHGAFNVPFCRKPDRFRPAYITRIVNQVAALQEIMAGKDWEFRCCDWRQTLDDAAPGDFVYLDPPYIGRHTGYFNTEWSQETAKELAARARALPAPVALSMWKETRHRRNDHLEEAWGWTKEYVMDHFYHVGSTESLRNSVVEALLIGGPAE